MSIDKLKQYLQNFSEERNWNTFHNPKNLVMALAGEAGELLDVFQRLTPEESEGDKLGPDNKQAAREEIADVFIYLIRLSDKLNINLEEAFWEKMEKNALKYPTVEKKKSEYRFNK